MGPPINFRDLIQEQLGGAKTDPSTGLPPVMQDTGSVPLPDFRNIINDALEAEKKAAIHKDYYERRARETGYSVEEIRSFYENQEAELAAKDRDIKRRLDFYRNPPSRKHPVAPEPAAAQAAAQATPTGETDPLAVLDPAIKVMHDEFFRFGKRHGLHPALPAIANMLPEIMLKAIAIHLNPVERNKSINRGFGTAADFGSALVVNPFASQGLGAEVKQSLATQKQFAASLWTDMVRPVTFQIAEIITGERTFDRADEAVPKEGAIFEYTYDRFGEQRAHLLNPAKMTDEQIEVATRSTVANGIGMIAGNVAGRAAVGALRGNAAIVGMRGIKKLAQAQEAGILPKLLDEIPTNKLLDLATNRRPTQFLEDITFGVTEAGVGGTTTGMIEKPTTREALDASVAYSMFAMPIALAHSSISAAARRDKVSGMTIEDVLSIEAGDMAKARQMFDVTQNSMLQNVRVLDNLIDTQDLAVTLLGHHVDMIHRGMDGHKLDRSVESGINAGIIPNIQDPLRIHAEVSRLQAEGRPIVAITHTRTSRIEGAKQKVTDILIAPEDIRPAQIEFFQRTGYMEGQQVGYNGNDRYVIESFSPPPERAAGQTTGRTRDRVTLRNVDTGTIVKDVRPKELARLKSIEIGGNIIMQNRTLALGDVFTQGFAVSHGRNPMQRERPSTNPDTWRYTQEYLQEGVRAEVLASTGGNIYINGLGNWAHTTYGELKPGINYLERIDPNTGLKKGNIVYMGGAQGINPRTGSPVIVGRPGEFVAVVSWHERKAQSGKWATKRGSTGFYSDVNQPFREVATDLVGSQRIQELGIKQSFSTLNPGSGSSLAKYLNLFSPFKVQGAFTHFDAKTVRNALYQDFLDFIGFDGERPYVPDDLDYNKVVTEAGYYGKQISQPGEKVSDVVARQDPIVQDVFDESANQGTRRTYENRRTSKISDERTVTEVIRQQNEFGEYPPSRPESQRGNLVHEQHNLDSMVEAYMNVKGIRPELKTELKNFFAVTLARELLGLENIRTRGANKDALPFLKERVAEIPALVKQLEDAMLKKFDSVSPPIIGGTRYSSAQSMFDARKQLLETKRVFEKRIEILEDPSPTDFTPKERGLYQRLVKEFEDSRNVPEKAFQLVNMANSSGYYIQSMEAGNFVFRDRETNAIVGPRFDSPEVAIDFLNETGRPLGSNLDGSGSDIVPPSSVVGPVLGAPDNPPRAWEVPHSIAPNGHVNDAFSVIDAALPFYTTKRSFFVALDNLFDTSFYERVYLPLQMHRLKLDSMKRPHLEAAQRIERLLESVTKDRERWKVISDNREAMSPQEVMDKYYRHRKLTDTEVMYGKRMAELNIDLDTVYSYRRAEKEIRDEYVQARAQWDERLRNDPADVNAKAKIQELEYTLAADIQAAQAAFNMDSNHLATSKAFDRILKLTKDEASLDAITRLANSIMNKEVGRAEHAVKHGLTDKERIAVGELDLLYEKVGKELGVDMTITNYMNHFRRYKDIPDQRSVRMNQDPDLITPSDRVAEFAHKISRSGELSIYERDPINAIVQYINAGFGEKHFNDVHRDATNAAAEELTKLSFGRGGVQKVANEYLNGMKGVPAASDQLIQGAFNKFFEKLGWDRSPDIRNDIVNLYLVGTSGSMLGFRPAQAARDFAQFSKIYMTRFGYDRWANALELAVKKDKDGVRAIQRLAEAGEIPGLGVLEFLSEQEIASSMTGKGTRLARDVIIGLAERGMKASGQHNVYALAHAMAYLDTHALATSTLLKLSRNEITKAQAYKVLDINSYDRPAALAFDRLVTAGDFGAAAKNLAHQTGAETAFIYGLQNHPYLWGTTIGRLAGQFGTWSMWTRNHLARTATRGTTKERAVRMGRYAIGEAATWAVGRATGFNMNSWYMHSGLLFLGGPAVQQVQDFEDLAGGNGKFRQTLAQNRWRRKNETGTVPPWAQWVPGASALNDYWEAYKLTEKRFGLVPTIGKGLGMSVDQTERSWLDDLTGGQPRLKK